jgi:hypothetical protein
MAVKWCVICSSNYDDKNIKNLEGAINSVNTLQSVVVSKLGVPEDNTLFIYDRTRDEIVAFFDKLKEDDMVVFYFCGHGLKIDKNLYFFVKNSNKENVEFTSLEYNLIVNILRNKKIKRIVSILDCCNSGAAISMGTENMALITNEVINEGQVIICSCSEVESSIQLEIENKLECAFTYTFAKVLSQGSSLSKKLLSINDIMDDLVREYKKYPI